MLHWEGFNRDAPRKIGDCNSRHRPCESVYGQGWEAARRYPSFRCPSAGPSSLLLAHLQVLHFEFLTLSTRVWSYYAHLIINSWAAFCNAPPPMMISAHPDDRLLELGSSRESIEHPGVWCPEHEMIFRQVLCRLGQPVHEEKRWYRERDLSRLFCANNLFHSLGRQNRHVCTRWTVLQFGSTSSQDRPARSREMPGYTTRTNYVSTQMRLPRVT